MRNILLRIIIIVGVAAFLGYTAYPPVEMAGREGKLNLGLDLKGGVHVVLQVDKSGLSEDAKKDAVSRAVEIIRNRVDEFGVSEPIIQPQGSNRIVVQLPGIEDPERAKALIGKTAQLEFKLVEDDEFLLKEALAGRVHEGYELAYETRRNVAGIETSVPLLLKSESVLTGASLVNAMPNFSSMEGPVVEFELDRKGAKIFEKVTDKYRRRGSTPGRRLAIVLDEKVQSAPEIRAKISNKGIISGPPFRIEEAKDLALVLRAGALPAPVEVIEDRSVGPTLGKDSVRQGVDATVLGFVLVVVFMMAYYLLPGIIAIIALLLNLVILIGVMSALNFTLTLPGIAGIILTIGMSVDANVLIFERIREELKSGKTLRTSIINGYKRAFTTIFDANLTTLITAAFLFQFGTGPVKGFAVTVSIGIIASMFTALFVTRTVFDLLTWRGRLTSLKMLQLIKEPRIDFMSKRMVAYVLSGVLIVAGIISFASKGHRNFGIDFNGGRLLHLSFEKPIQPGIIRPALDKMGLGDSVIQHFGSDREVLIKTGEEHEQGLEQNLRDAIPDNHFRVERSEFVGPAVGRDLRQKALLALIFAMMGIVAYISWRFEFKFAIAAIIALLHDVLITVGVFSVTGREISLPIIAALLTIVGYSINDTIVVFDRIREDLKLMKKADYVTIVNTSINQTISRTLLTSLTTLLVVISLYLYGGEVINDFAFAFIVGIIVGTYSSIFVASAILVDWHRSKA